MKRFLNPRFAGAILFCALVWVWIASTGVKLADLYDQRGDQSFRRLLAERLHHKIDDAFLIAGRVDDFN